MSEGLRTVINFFAVVGLIETLILGYLLALYLLEGDDHYAT